eukprot:scaffold30617_cov18-Tisochrysis_lutea.AAC.1
MPAIWLATSFILSKAVEDMHGRHAIWLPVFGCLVCLSMPHLVDETEHFCSQGKGLQIIADQVQQLKASLPPGSPNVHYITRESGHNAKGAWRGHASRQTMNKMLTSCQPDLRLHDLTMDMGREQKGTQQVFPEFVECFSVCLEQ